MRIWYSPYQLQFKKKSESFNNNFSRVGALLKIEFNQGEIGYCDLHPWESFGDLSLTHQLEILKQGGTTPLSQASLNLAFIDAQARVSKRNLFDGKSIPLSHRLFLEVNEDLQKNINLTYQEGFEYIKIKIKDFKKETLYLNNLELPQNIKIRLDFNQGFSSYNYFMSWLSELNLNFLSQIDFIEDPFDFKEKNNFPDLKKSVSLPIAVDHHINEFITFEGPLNFDVWVYKPARMMPDSFIPKLTQGCRLVVTSYMDHPVGQMGAAYVAALLKCQFSHWRECCGLLTHELYESQDFKIISKGSKLIPSEGLGIGFDETLEKQKWILLN